MRTNKFSESCKKLLQFQDVSNRFDDSIEDCDASSNGPQTHIGCHAPCAFSAQNIPCHQHYECNNKRTTDSMLRRNHQCHLHYPFVGIRTQKNILKDIKKRVIIPNNTVQALEIGNKAIYNKIQCYSSQKKTINNLTECLQSVEYQTERLSHEITGPDSIPNIPWEEVKLGEEKLIDENPNIIHSPISHWPICRAANQCCLSKKFVRKVRSLSDLEEIVPDEETLNLEKITLFPQNLEQDIFYNSSDQDKVEKDIFTLLKQERNKTLQLQKRCKELENFKEDRIRKEEELNINEIDYKLKENALRRKDDFINAKENNFKVKETEFQKKENEFRKKVREFEEKKNEFKKLKEEFTEKENEFKQKENQFDIMKDKLSMKEKEIYVSNQNLIKLKEEVKQLQTKVKQLIGQNILNENKQKEIDSLCEEIRLNSEQNSHLANTLSEVENLLKISTKNVRRVRKILAGTNAEESFEEISLENINTHKNLSEENNSFINKTLDRSENSKNMHLSSRCKTLNCKNVEDNDRNKISIGLPELVITYSEFEECEHVHDINVNGGIILDAETETQPKYLALD